MINTGGLKTVKNNYFSHYLGMFAILSVGTVCPRVFCARCTLKIALALAENLSNPDLTSGNPATLSGAMIILYR